MNFFWNCRGGFLCWMQKQIQNNFIDKNITEEPIQLTMTREEAHRRGYTWATGRVTLEIWPFHSKPTRAYHAWKIKGENKRGNRK